MKRFLVVWSVVFGSIAAISLLRHYGTPWFQWFCLGTHIGILLGIAATGTSRVGV